MAVTVTVAGCGPGDAEPIADLGPGQIVAAGPGDRHGQIGSELATQACQQMHGQLE